MKSSTQWRREHGAALTELVRAKAIQRGIAIYGGDRRLRDGDVDVLPWSEFAKELDAGRVIGV